jgi:AcrR family transcriptional regulator
LIERSIFFPLTDKKKIGTLSIAKEKGMKKKLNLHQQAAEKARAKILETARGLFIDLGFSGTSIGALARAAGINQSLIYHYFESKEDLWRQVKAEMIASSLKTNQLESAPPIDNLEELLRNLLLERFHVYLQNPDLVRLLMWQALEDKQAVISGTSASWTQSWTRVIQELQEKGIIVKRLTPEEILLLINGIVWASFLTLPSQDFSTIGDEFCQKMMEELKKLLT